MPRSITSVRRCLLVFGVAFALLLTGMPTQSAQALAVDEGAAWHLKVDFPNNQLQVIYTLYEVGGKPLKVTDIIQVDITPTCITEGKLSFDADGYALFDGGTAIRCALPPLKAHMQSCDCPVPFWAAADVRMASVNGQHPLIEGRTGATREFTVSMPRQGGNVATQLVLFNQSYLSSSWTPATRHQWLLSSKGAGLIDVADALDAVGVRVLDYVPDWRNHFVKIAPTAQTLDLLVQPDGLDWATSFPGSPWMHPQYVYIGYSPTSGAFFTGGIKHLEVDPPGCRGGI